MMKQTFLLAALVISAVFIAGCVQQSPNPGQNNTQPSTYVSIKDFAFSPSEIMIKKGETVVWKNEDSAPHTVVSDSGNEINSPSLATGQTYSHTFYSAGTFNYYCSIHPSMKARIIVE